MIEVKKILLTLTLALTVSVFLFSGVALAENKSEPWNVDVTVVFDGVRRRYDLKEAATGLDDDGVRQRGVYLGLPAKRKLFAELKAQGFSAEESLCYLLPSFKDMLTEMKGRCNKEAQDAVVRFTPHSARKFVYTEGKDGAYLDVDRLAEALFSGRERVEAPLCRVAAVTKEELLAKTTLRSTFSTTFAASGANRSDNIAVAAKKIKGTVLPAGDTFSFNRTVGARTEENGFKISKVIVNGEYTDGVGGGVCQVSTTLYNAALLAGLDVCEVHRHTLVSSYVAPSFDAMVAYPNADLKFTNDTGSPLYIDAEVSGKKITFTLYGEEKEYDVVRKSVEKERTPFRTVEIDPTDYPELVYTDQVKVVTGGSDFVRSVGILQYFRKGKLVKSRQIRQDTYKRVDKVVARGKTERPREEADAAA